MKTVTSVSSLEQGEIYIGVVERFSSSGNANVQLPSYMDRKFVNLGPIDIEAKGKMVRFKFLETGWGECLTEKYTYDGYDPRDGVEHSSTRDQELCNEQPLSTSSSPENGSGKTSDPENKNKLLNGKL